jgi:hypothetical protein
VAIHVTRRFSQQVLELNFSLPGKEHQMKKAFIIALSIAGTWATNAHSTPGEASNVKVVQVFVSRAFGNFAFVHLSDPPAARTSCSTNPYWFFTLNIADPQGRNMYAQLLAAQASGSFVNIKGADACSEYWDSESINGLGIADSPQ